MSNQTWQETLVTSQSDGAALTGTSIASIIPAQAKYTLPASKIWYPGQMLKVTAQGRVSNIATTPGTFTATLKMGATIVAVSSAMQLNATVQTNATFWLEWLLTCRVAGAAGNFMHIGDISALSFGSGAVVGTAMIPTSAPAVGSNVDLTAAQQVDLQGQFSLTGNSLTVHMYKLELLN